MQQDKSGGDLDKDRMARELNGYKAGLEKAKLDLEA